MVARGVAVFAVNHALECIEADDEVQISLPRIPAADCLDHINVESVRRYAYRYASFACERQPQHLESILERAFVFLFICVGPARESNHFVEGKSVGCAPYQLDMRYGRRIE